MAVPGARKAILFSIFLVHWGAVAMGQDNGPTPMQLALKEAIERSKESYAKAKILKADRNSQIERVRASWADLGPRVKLDYTLSQFEKEMATGSGDQKNISRPEVLKQGSLTIAQPITGLGALTKKALFEETQLEIKQDTYELSKTEGAFLAAELWLTTFQLDQLSQIAESSVKAVEQQLRDASAMERVGRLNRGDVLKLELAVSESKMRLTQTLTARATAMANLSEIVGINPQTAIKLPADIPEFAFAEYSLEKSLDLARAQRLDSRVSKNSVELAEFGKSLVYSQFSPQINLFVKADRNFGLPYLPMPGRISRSYGVNITWDIWNNGFHVFALREAQDQVVKAEEAAKASDSRTAIEVQNAFSSYNSAKVALNLAMTAVKQADEAFRIESIRFKTGARSATDLIIAESSHAQAKGRLITAKVDLANNYFKYQKSMGYEAPKF